MKEKQFTTSITTKLSKKMFDVFFYNRKYFGRQEFDENGKVVYFRKRNKVTAAIVQNMLENKKSVMSYQQVRQKLKWICLDIDISKEYLDNDFDFFKADSSREKLFEIYRRTTEILIDYKIRFLSEFSGNRGIHIWIFFDSEISKDLGFMIVNKIDKEINQHNKDNIIVIDKYPKNGSAKNNTIGLGVKIPLSFHLKSNRYSYLIQNLEEIKQLNCIDSTFLEHQYNILNSIEYNNVNDVINQLNLKKEEKFFPFQRKSMSVKGQINLEIIISTLSKSVFFESLFKKPLAHWNEKDRVILVASLIRITDDENEKIGLSLLKEFFSRDEEFYDENLTNEKLKNLKGLYPPNIEYLEKIYDNQCNYCYENEILNVYDLLSRDLNVKILEHDITDIELKRIVRAEINYLKQNDEVSLTYIEDELKNIKITDIKENLNFILDRSYDESSLEFNEFIRHESEEKERTLYSFGAVDRVLSTTAAIKLTEFVYGDFSVNSYAYRLNKNNFDYIFENWSTAWLDYVYSVEGILNDSSYDEYYLIKMDIKSFYNSIVHSTLREVILESVKINNNETKNSEIFPYIDYLLKISRKTLQSDIGVPQGPAYARVLAELYLSRLDIEIEKFIDTDFESYYRYVDDMVIILKNQERATELLQKIRTMLNYLSLSINNNEDKFQTGFVKDLKYKVITKSFEKYFVDTLRYDDTSEELVENAKKLLNDLLKNEIDDIEINQLPFYLTHLFDKEVFDNKKREIGEFILNTSLGRGSLFKHFFNNVLFAYESIPFEISQLVSLRGLSRSNFISVLIKKYDQYPIEFTQEIVKSYFNQNLLPYEKKEILRLALFTNTNLDELKLEHKDLEILIDNLKYAKNIKISDEIIKKILPIIQERTNLYSLKNTIQDMDALLANSTNLNCIDEIVKTYEDIINIPENIELDKDAAQKLADIVCFISFYSSLEFDGFSMMWGKIVHLGETYQLSMNEWYKYKKHIQWDKVKEQLLILFITNILREISINPQLPVSYVEKEYVSFLLLFLFEIDNEDGITDKPDFLTIKKIIKDKEIEFLEWCIDEEKEYYPEKAIARLNTFYNKRVVFLKDNRLFIRAKADISKYISTEVRKDAWLNGEEYVNFILEITPEEPLRSIYEKLSGKSVTEKIKMITLLMKKIDDGEKYNFFERGTFVDSSDDIYFKYSRLDEKIVISKDNILDTQEKNMKYELIKLMSREDLVDQGDSSYKYNPKDFNNEFIPPNLTIDKQIEFFSFLGKYLEENSISKTNIYGIESAKIYAIIQFLKKDKKNYKQIDILSKYATLSSNNLDRLLAFKNNGSDIDDNFFFSLIENILEKINFDHFPVLNKLYVELKEVESLARKHFDKNLKRISKIRIDYKDASRVSIDGEIFKTNEIKVLYPFNHSELEDILPNDLSNLLNQYSVYSAPNSTIIMAIPLKGLILLKEKISKINNIEIIYLLNKNLDVVKNYEFYPQAISNILKQNDIQSADAHAKLVLFLAQFDQKYYSALLKLIAEHKVIDSKQCIKYLQDLKILMDKEIEACIMPLKTEIDDNGFHVMITTIGREQGFDRNSGYKNRIYSDYEKINLSSGSDNTLIFLIDLGLSGKQFKMTLTNYRNNGDLSNEYFAVKDGAFNKYLKNTSKLIIFSMVYTDIFEDEVNKFFESVFKELNVEKPEIIVLGEKILKEEYAFKNRLEYSDQQLVIEALDIPKYQKLVLYTDNRKSFSKYLEDLKTEKTSNILIARYKSMPKGHFIPLTENSILFNYRNDQK